MKFWNALLKVILCALIGLVILALGGFLWLKRTLSPEQLKPRLEAEASRYLGRKLTLEDVGWTIRPIPLLIAHGVRVFDADNRLTAEDPAVKIYLDYPALSRGRLLITDLVLQEIQIFLPLGQKKPADFVQMVYQIAARPSAKSGGIALKQLSIQGGRAHLRVPAREKEGSLIPIQLEGLLSFGSPSALRATLSVSSPSATAAVEIPDLSGTRCQMQIRSRDSELLELVSLVDRLKSLTAGLPSPDSAKSKSQWHLAGDFLGRRLTIRSFPVQSINARFQMSAGYRSPMKGTFEIQAEKPTWKDGVRFETVKTSGTFDDGIRHADISATHGMIRETAIQSISMTYHQEAAGRFEVQKLQLEGMHGTLAGRGRVSPSEIDLAWEGRDLDVQELAKAFRQKIAVTGTANSTGWLRGDRRPWPNRTLEGAVDLKIRKGISIGLPGLLKTLSALNIETLLKKKRDGQEGIPFETFEGTGTIHTGILHITRPLLFTNETLEIAYLGSLDLVDEQINGQMAVTFLTVVDEFVRVIPGVRTILHNGKKSIVPMIVTIKGPWDNPSTQAKRLEGAAASAWKAAGGALRIPRRIIDSITPDIFR